MAHGSEAGEGLALLLVICCPCVLLAQLWKLIYALLLGLVAGVTNLFVAFVLVPINIARMCTIALRSSSLHWACKPMALLVTLVVNLLSPIAWLGYGISRGVYCAYVSMSGLNINECQCNSDARENPLRNVFIHDNRRPPLRLFKDQREWSVDFAQETFDWNLVDQRQSAAMEYFAQTQKALAERAAANPQVDGPAVVAPEVNAQCCVQVTVMHNSDAPQGSRHATATRVEPEIDAAATNLSIHQEKPSIREQDGANIVGDVCVLCLLPLTNTTMNNCPPACTVAQAWHV